MTVPHVSCQQPPLQYASCVLLHRLYYMIVFSTSRRALAPAEVSAILRDAWDGFRRGFVLAYAGRAGLGVMTRALTLVRRRQFADALGWRLLSEKTLVYRRAALPALRDGEPGSAPLCETGPCLISAAVPAAVARRMALQSVLAGSN